MNFRGSMKYVKALGILFCLTVLIFLSCTHYQKVADVFLQPSFREKYERKFKKEDTLFIKWKNSFEFAKKDSLIIETPYQEQLNNSAITTSAVSYQIPIMKGEQLIVEIQKTDSIRNIFVDIFSLQSHEKPIIEDFLATEKQEVIRLYHPGTFQIIIQPELSDSLSYSVTFDKQPVYTFPVAGKDSKAIESFWGAPRDGGRRMHKGIDIFAKRGTPVVAAVNGRISSTGNRGLGGKQVWLRDPEKNYSLYYAHLDSIAVTSFQNVKVGDTLGFVGNTGNARTTAPHLHFAIYTNYGAIDPLLFVKEQKEAEQREAILLKEMAEIEKGSNIRNGPGTSYSILSTLSDSIKFAILGKTKDWYRIQLTENEYGFVHESLVY